MYFAHACNAYTHSYIDAYMNSILRPTCNPGHRGHFRSSISRPLQPLRTFHRRPTSFAAWAPIQITWGRRLKVHQEKSGQWAQRSTTIEDVPYVCCVLEAIRCLELTSFFRCRLTRIDHSYTWSQRGLLSPTSLSLSSPQSTKHPLLFGQKDEYRRVHHRPVLPTVLS